MDFNSTVDLILKDLEEAGKIIDDLKNYPGVPAIQVELAKSKCKSAGEVIALLKTQPAKEMPVKTEKRKAVQAIINEEPVQEKQNTGRPAEAGVIIADTFNLTDRLNEQMGNLRDDDKVTEIIKAKPLSSLADAIGVNDKFLYIRELFNGSPETYDHAISRLNNALSYSEASDALMGYAGEKKESEVVKQLLDLLKRKFPSDE